LGSSSSSVLVVPALAGVRAVETVLEQRPVGALTPAQVFGADWVLEIEGTRRFDQLFPSL
jgi:short subunit dehydrogenase-like uncharacterized protein